MHAVLSNLLLLQRRELLVGDPYPSGVEASVQLGMGLKAGAGPGRADQLHDHLVAGKWATRPVHGDVGEEPVLELG